MRCLSEIALWLHVFSFYLPALASLFLSETEGSERWEKEAFPYLVIQSHVRQAPTSVLVLLTRLCSQGHLGAPGGRASPDSFHLGPAVAGCEINLSKDVVSPYCRDCFSLWG